MAVHDGERFLGRALRSIREQTLPPDEIVVCDDASTDATPRILAELAAGDGRIRRLHNDRSLGGYGAMNRAVAESTGEFVAVYHADDVYGPEILETSVRFLRKHPGAGVVFALDRFIDESGREYGRLQLPTQLAGGGLFDAAGLLDAVLRHKNSFLPTPSACFRRVAFDSLGGFDQERWGIAADLDMWLRMSLEWQIGLVPRHLFDYRHYPEQWSRRYERLRTRPEKYFEVVEAHLARPGVDQEVDEEARVAFRCWRAIDDIERASNLVMLGRGEDAEEVLASAEPPPRLLFRRPDLVPRVLVLRSLVRLAAKARTRRQRRWAGAAIHWARFRSPPPRRPRSSPVSVDRTLAGSDDSPAVGLYIDPPSSHFLADRLFDPETARFGGAEILAPYIALRDHFRARGIPVHTADLLDEAEGADKKIYVSLGRLPPYREIESRRDVVLSAYFALECPIVEPTLYAALPEAGRHFRHVFSWSTTESLLPFTGEPVAVERFFWPQSRDSVVGGLWEREDRGFLVMINSNKLPRLYYRELYTARLEAVEYFHRFGEIDLFGTNWQNMPNRVGRTWVPATFRLLAKRIWKAWQRIRPNPLYAAARAAHRGVTESKLDTLAGYDFALCFENARLEGWITEKLFDCLYVGTVPVYWGAPDVQRWVPPECFVDMRRFRDFAELRSHLHDLTRAEVDAYREAGRDFLASEAFDRFRKAAFVEHFTRIVEEVGGATAPEDSSGTARGERISPGSST